MKGKMEKAMGRAFGIAMAVLCAPLALFVTARYMLTVYAPKMCGKDYSGSEHKSKGKGKTSRVRLALSLAYYLVALSALNIPAAVIQRTRAGGKVARHIYAMYVVMSIIAVFKMAALMRPSPARSR